MELQSSIAAESAKAKGAGLDYRAIATHPAFVPVVLLSIGLFLSFQVLLTSLPEVWLSGDGYYSHGFLVPLISGYIIFRWWPKLKEIPAKPFWPALLPLAGVMYITWVATVYQTTAILSLLFIMALLLGTWFVLGFRWMVALALPILYLGFMLPVFGPIIDQYTNPLQVYSTKVSYALLQLFGMQPFAQDATTILLPHFALNVGIPCSGLRLILALTAFIAFFILIGNLKWWANLVMLALLFPLAMLINGLRIALIGVVGNTYGHDAGMTFHDYSGYITLIICFFILFKIARLLGWKD